MKGLVPATDNFKCEDLLAFHFNKKRARFHRFVHFALRALIGRGVAGMDIPACRTSPFFHFNLPSYVMVKVASDLRAGQKAARVAQAACILYR
jgi:hypothetical protein